MATDLLARADARELAIVGAGVQARAHLLAIALVRRLERVRVAGRDRARAERLAADLQGQGGRGHHRRRLGGGGGPGGTSS